MHIYFSGIGGVGISALAVIAKQAGYDVSGSDANNSQYLDYLRKKGITELHVGMEKDQIARIHQQNPIDWYVYGSFQVFEHPDNDEFKFCQEMGIKTSKRDEFLNAIISQQHLKLIAVAGTHGKSTTTAMAVWAMQQLGQKISYSIGAKIPFGDMGHFETGSEYFVYECDEFDRIFLAFHPFYSIITGIGWDHQEIYPTPEDYNKAFRDFLSQSQRALLWQEDVVRLSLSEEDEKYTIADPTDKAIENIKLPGLYNRRDAWLVVKAVSQITGARPEKLVEIMSRFPGLSRRFEKLTDNLYTDYAHTPEKIVGCMSVAKEVAKPGQNIVVIYEPLTNRRMHHLGKEHRDVFEGASAIYWVPSYLAREDPNLPILAPEELIKNLSPHLQEVAHTAKLDDNLKSTVQKHLKNGDMVVALSGGATLDEWLRREFLEA
jgi:UDP-N-acetylmuramate--alanine ligase